MSKVYDLGTEVKILFVDDIPKIIKLMSKDTWLIRFPQIFAELLYSNKQTVLETIRYAPNIYFYLKEDFKRDKQIIKATINSFERHKKIHEINISTIPLTRIRKGVKNGTRTIKSS